MSIAADGAVALSIFDLDRTITRVPTWSLFLLFVARTRAPWRLALIPVVGVAAALKAVRAIGRDRLKEVMHGALIGRRCDADVLTTLSERFAQAFVGRNVLDGARQQIAADRAEGRRVVIATAAHRFYAEPIARALGIADLVATEARRDAHGRVLATIDGRNCYGPAKLLMIERWLAEQGIARGAAHVRFYSDHLSDRPTFEWADDPVAVNAHPPLARLARARGWRTLDWR